MYSFIRQIFVMIRKNHPEIWTLAVTQSFKALHWFSISLGMKYEIVIRTYTLQRATCYYNSIVKLLPWTLIMPRPSACLPQAFASAVLFARNAFLIGISSHTLNLSQILTHFIKEAFLSTLFKINTLTPYSLVLLKLLFCLICFPHSTYHLLSTVFFSVFIANLSLLD